MNRSYLKSWFYLLLFIFAAAAVVYSWSIAFDEDLRSEKGSIPYYLLIGSEIKALPLPVGHHRLRYHSFPGDGSAQPFEEVEFLLPAAQRGPAAAKYDGYFSAMGCARSEDRDGPSGRTAISWRCEKGKFELLASKHIVRNNSGALVETGEYAVRVAFHPM